MPDVLDFNPNRDLGFDSDRERGFDSARSRQFDPDRDLKFDPDRDLGFGKRGVVFRGYVCPVCGAAVGETDPSCAECHAVFEPKEVPRARAPPPPIAPPAAPPAAAPRYPPPPPPTDVRPPPPPVRTYPQPPKRTDARNCVFCGARVTTTDAFCWNCGNRMYAGPGP